jgi:hypothetical protein
LNTTRDRKDDPTVFSIEEGNFLSEYYYKAFKIRNITTAQLADRTNKEQHSYYVKADKVRE